MAANIEKIKGCFRALVSFLKNMLTLKFPLWLFIVAYLASVLFVLCVGCQHDKAMMRQCIVGSMDFKGHSYLVFTRPGASINGALDVMHDPDCICWLVDSIN